MKINIINIVILVIVLVGTLAALSIMPDTVPVHFDIHGVADRWGSKYEMLVMPGCMLAMLAFWLGVDASYKKKIETSFDEKEVAEAKSNLKVIKITSIITSLMFAVINGLTLYASYSQLEGSSVKEIDILKMLSIVMGIFFIILGNFMPKAKNNPNLGFRLTWTRFNDKTWRKSNLIGGIAMIIQGVIMVLGGILFNGTVAMIIMLVTLVIVLPAISIYAYVVYANERDKSNDQE